MNNGKIYPIHFAPLQGFTEFPYRNAHKEIFGGIASYYTPFVRIEKGVGFRKKELKDISPKSNTVFQPIPQLIAATPEELRILSQLFTEFGYTKADINLGCPFPMLAKHHKGSGILPFPDEVKRLLTTIEEFPRINFSVKLRLGWDKPEECLTLLPILNNLPLKQITMHARLGKQQYKGNTDQQAFDAFYKECSHPLLYNGDMSTPDDIENITDRFPNLSGVMIGRGLLANPALALEYINKEKIPSDEMRYKLHLFHEALWRHYNSALQGEVQILNKMRTFWNYLLPQMDKKLKKRILKSTQIESYYSNVNEAINQMIL